MLHLDECILFLTTSAQPFQYDLELPGRESMLSSISFSSQNLGALHPDCYSYPTTPFELPQPALQIFRIHRECPENVAP